MTLPTSFQKMRQNRYLRARHELRAQAIAAGWDERGDPMLVAAQEAGLHAQVRAQREREQARVNRSSIASVLPAVIGILAAALIVSNCTPR